MRAAFVAFAVLLPASSHLLAQAAPKPAPDLFAVSRQARDAGRFGMLLRQFRADEPTLAERHEAGSKPATPLYQGARDIPAGHWVWQRPYWFVFRDGPDLGPQQRGWGPEAACGAPDSEPGDHDTAWAPKEQDGKGEWLLLEFEMPLRATTIEVHENCNPGALEAIAILLPNGEVLELWRNREVKATEEKARVLQLDLPLGFLVERVLLQFASEAVPGWNEVDAVGLRDDKGKLHWASRAEASSTYAQSDAPAAAPIFLGGFVAARVLPLNVQIELPRLVVQAREVQLDVLPAARLVQFAPVGDGAEKQQMQQRITELEAKVAQLEADLARAKAGK